jgi:hypothetical protein
MMEVVKEKAGPKRPAFFIFEAPEQPIYSVSPSQTQTVTVTFDPHFPQRNPPDGVILGLPFYDQLF